MSSNPTIPSADQLAAIRTRQWHQNGEALLTFENLRSWINAAGLALYAPRPAQLPAPAPSMLEAVLGTANAAPTLAEAEQPRTLLARLVAEGAAVPLNLLGSPTGVGTDTPDFIAATAVLPYIFTLRGDKTWKLAPETSGSSKVSPLALAAYTALAEKKSALSAAALATELGKEVTETAVLRALTELWQHLRVLPIPQQRLDENQDSAPTLWELTSARFTKQLKAGANAGQPSALSALISLYLGQAIVATEAEIETFLSPLAARSRIRDVIHALLGARQLETIAVEGRTVLHVAGDLPAFLNAPVAESALPGEVAVPVDDIDHLVVTTEGGLPVTASAQDEAGPAPRIKKFVPTPRKIGTGFVTKPGYKLGLDKPARKPFGTQPSGAEPAARPRRPFTRESNRPDRPSFTKPWAEEKADRLAAAARASSTGPEADGISMTAAAGESVEANFSQPTFERKPAFSNRPTSGGKFGGKPSFSRKPSFGAKPSFGSRPAFGAKRFDSGQGDSRPARREFTPRPFDRSTQDRSTQDRSTQDRSASPDRGQAPSRGASGDFAPRKTFSKPGTFGRKREGGFSSRPAPDRSAPDRPSSDRPYSTRPSFGRGSDSRPPRRDFSPRPGGDARPPRRDFGSKPAFGGKPSFPRREAPGSASDTAAPRYRKFDAPRTRPAYPDRPARPFQSDRPARPQSGGYAGKSSSFGDKKPYAKSSGNFAGKKPFGKSAGFSGKPAGTFDKFKDNKKPFGKRPPARKWKPEESKPAE